MNIAKMMKQAQKMQADMQKIQEDLSQRQYTAEAGSGMVSATVSGDGQLHSLTIKPELIKDAADDPEMLQDMIITAVREAIDQSKADAQEAMGKVTSGMNIPGLG